MGSSGKYDNEFDQQRLIGGGGFGKAYEVVKKDDKSKSVIKKIFCTDNRECDEMIRDLEIGSKIRSDSVVPIGKYWSEKVICRQMECCSGNLRQIIETKPQLFSSRSNDSAIGLTDYFISCEILEEITRCLDILHSTYDSATIAQNLKPENFLITDGNNESKQFLKLSDFGYYFAPNPSKPFPVIGGKHINEKSDIYALGVIAYEVVFGPNDFARIFEAAYNTGTLTNSRKEMLRQMSVGLKPRYELLELRLREMIDISTHCRPSADKALAEISSMHLTDKNEINEIKVKLNVLNLNSAQHLETFFRSFLKTKIDLRLKPITKAESDLKSQRKNAKDLNTQLTQSIAENSGKYEKDFKQNELIGKGYFSKVYEVMGKKDRKVFAIKQIVIHNKSVEELKVLKELSTIFNKFSKIRSEYVVQYLDMWIEKHTIYIQMDRYSGNLAQIIEKKKHLFSSQSNDYEMSLIDYFMSSEIFEEVTRCVNYLHTSNPPIIAKNLKPENFLITDGNNDSKHFLKLSDFGYYLQLPEIVKKEKHPKRSYASPEMIINYGTDKHVDIKSDIYSLALIAQEVYGINLLAPESAWNQDMKKKNDRTRPLYEALQTPILNMITSPNWKRRPNCDEVLKQTIVSIRLDRNAINKIKVKLNELNLDSAQHLKTFFRSFLSTKIDSRIPSSGLDAIKDLKSQLDQFQPQIGDKYNKEFQQQRLIGGGSYGKVYEVLNKRNQKFAIKQIEFKGNEWEEEFKTLKNLLKIRSDFVVQYIDVWEEKKTIYIQMELCSYSLNEIMGKQSELLASDSVKDKALIDYFISCEIFEEITRSLNYLHSCNPPVIHRDLKPENILCPIPTTQSTQFFKLSDFGYMKPPEGYKAVSGIPSDKLRKNKGKYQFVPYEVLEDKGADMPSDIYSLGLIGQELFRVFLLGSKEDRRKQIEEKISLRSGVKTRYTSLESLLLSMLEIKDPKKRPICGKVLTQIDNLHSSNTDIKKIKEISKDILKSSDSRGDLNTFLQIFVTTKANLRIKSKTS